MTVVISLAVLLSAAMLADAVLDVGSRYVRLGRLVWQDAGTARGRNGAGKAADFIDVCMRSVALCRVAIRCQSIVPRRWVEVAVSELDLTDPTTDRDRCYLAVAQLATGAVSLMVATVAFVSLSVGPAVFMTGVLTVTSGGYVFPIYLLWSRRRRRVELALNELATLVGLLACCADAGLSLAGALETVAARFGGVLGEELRRALTRGHGIGGLAAGLEQMAQRLDHPAIRSVLQSLVYAERLGTPLSLLLRRHGRAVGVIRRQAMVDRIATANARLTVCTIFLLLPATIAAVVVPSLFGLLYLGW